MPKLAVHTLNGNTIAAPFEAWVVALINALPTELQQEVFKRVAQMHDVSVIPDKYLIGEDELGTIVMVEKPVLDFGRKI